MGHLEKIWLEQYDPAFCFAADNDQGTVAFFNYIDSQQPNILCIMEREINHKVPFLDVLFK